MLGSFKIRMLLVIAIVTLTGLALQSNNRSQELLQPVIQYVLRDYGVEQKLALYLENIRDQDSGKGVTVSGDINLQVPCEFNMVERHYGWHWNREKGIQEFFPGVVLQVKKGTLVKPTMAGRVAEIKGEDEGRQIKIIHNDGLVSLYGGLREVLVKENVMVESDQVLGKAGDHLYFEFQNQDGPLNPEAILSNGASQ